MKMIMEFKYVGAGVKDNTTIKSLSFSVLEGEFVSLIGARSVVIKTIYMLLTGELACGKGEILYQGEPYTPRSIIEFQRKKVFLISSQSSLIDRQSVAENICLNHSRAALASLVNTRFMVGKTKRLLFDFGLEIDAEAPVCALSPAMKCLIEMVKFYALGAKLMVLHDIGSFETDAEHAMFSQVMKQLHKEGVSVLLLLNRYSVLAEEADRLLLISCEGRLVRTLYHQEYQAQEVTEFLNGSFGGHDGVKAGMVKGAEVFRLENFSTSSFSNVNLTLYEKEVIGLFSADGRVADELMLAVTGLQEYDGHIYLREKLVTIGSPESAIAHGIGLIPADLGSLYFPDLTKEDNMTILFGKRLSKLGGMIDSNRLSALIDDGKKHIARFKKELPGGSDDEDIYSVITRFLLYPFRVVLVMHPSMENDVIKTNALFRFIEEAANRGSGLIITSRRLDELEKVCTRIHFLNS